MAITLTTSWQNVANSTWVPGTGFSVTFYLDAKYSTQSTINNNTTVQTRLRSVVNSGSGSGYNYSFSCSYANTVSGSGLWTLETETITSGESTITHNQDGTKTITLSASARINGIGMNVSMSGDAILPRINRYATLSSAPDFTDEANPKITFTKNVASTATVYAGIYNSSGTTAYASYRDITSSVSSGEYTFNLTTTERNAMRNAIPNAKTLQVQFKLYTTISGTNFDGGSITKTMTIVNANPTLTSATYSEQNAKVSALLGSSGTTVVQNVSTIRMGITATALKGASISKVVATHNNQPLTDTSSPYSFDIPIKTNSLTAVATDSRNNPSLTFSKTWSGSNYITYKPVAINTLTFKRQTETGGIILLSLDATYYQRTFGSTANAPIVKWKMGNGSWTTLTSSQYSIDTTNNKLTVSSLSLGDILNYESEATFYLYIEDKLSTAQNDRFVSVGIPTLDIGKDDVIVNGSFKANNIDFSNINSANILWKEYGYGDKFRIIPAFGGSDDDNKLKIQGTVGGSGTDPTNFTDLLTVSGKSGNVNVTGNVISPTIRSKLETLGGRITNANIEHTYEHNRAHMQLLQSSGSMTSNKPANDGYILHFSWDNNNQCPAQFYFPQGDHPTVQMQFRSATASGTWTGWEDVYRAKVLYSNASGTSGTVTLSESASNFKFFDISYRTNDGNNFVGTTRIDYYNTSGNFNISYNKTTNPNTWLKSKLINISGTSITNNGSNYVEYQLSTNGTSASNVLHITRVVGYR